MPATLGLWMVYAWHADLCRTHMFAKNMCVSVRLGAHVSLPTGMCIARLHPHLSMPSVWKHLGGPLCEAILRPVSGWEPRASEELIWGQDLGREASGCLSPTPGFAGTDSISLASWWKCHVGQNQQPPWNQDRWQLLLVPRQWSPSLYHWRGN